MSDARPLHFNAFIYPNGYHESAWRLVDDDVRGVLGLPYYAEHRRDRRARPDGLGLPRGRHRGAGVPRHAHPADALRPDRPALGARRGHEPHRAVGTGSTTYSKPWDLARRFATLDHLSAGRAGWNIVTTNSVLAAANFGEAAHPQHADRYARAHEFVAAVRARLGLAGRTTPWSATASAASGPTARSCTRRASTASSTTSRASCRSRARPRAGRCSRRPGSRRPGSGSPRATPR